MSANRRSVPPTLPRIRRVLEWRRQDEKTLEKELSEVRQAIRVLEEQERKLLEEEER